MEGQHLLQNWKPQETEQRMGNISSEVNDESPNKYVKKIFFL